MTGTVRPTMPRLIVSLALAAWFMGGCGATTPTRISGDVDSLLRGGVADGQPVRVTGFFIADKTSAQLCGVALESYPPQCGGASVHLVGQVSPDTLGQLEHTGEDGLAQRTWGWVVVTGTFRPVGVEGEPTVELGEVILEEG